MSNTTVFGVLNPDPSQKSAEIFENYEKKEKNAETSR